MSATTALAVVLLAPLLRAAFAVLASRPPGLRDAAQILLAAAHLIAAVALFLHAQAGAPARFAIAQPLPQVSLSFALEPIGAVLSLLMASLSALHTVHAVAFLRASREPAPARMQAFMALSLGAATALALSANLFTFLLAAQMLALVGFPLVAHENHDAARRAGATFLAAILTASVALFLPAMVWTYALTGQLDFRPGGVFARPIDPVSLNALLALFMLGVAPACFPPFHAWSPAAAKAPFPAFSMLQGMAVATAGGAGVLKIATYIFGARLREAHLAATGLMALAGLAMIAACLVAFSKRDMRERIAYTMIAQCCAAALGALIAAPTGTFAAVLQLVAQAMGASTMSMAAAAIYVSTGQAQAVGYEGMARVMPWTTASFAIGAASIIGAPPFSGAWARLWLVTATADAGLFWASALLVAAAVLSFALWAPIAARALAGPPPSVAARRPDSASMMMVAPIIAAAIGTLSLLFLADPLARFMSSIWR